MANYRNISNTQRAFLHKVKDQPRGKEVLGIENGTCNALKKRGLIRTDFHNRDAPFGFAYFTEAGLAFVSNLSRGGIEG